MTDQDVATRVKKLIAEKFSISEDTIDLSSSLQNDLGADSLDAVELVMSIEEEFDLEIPDEDAEKLTTVSQIIEYIKNHKQ
jgi:acyl carrier protein